MAEPKVLTAEAWIVLERRAPYRVAVVRTTVNEPRLERGQRAVRIRFEVDDALWTPAPTPGTTIQVHAPIYPDPEVLAAEWPQSPLTDRPEDPDDGQPEYDPHADGHEQPFGGGA